VTRRLEKKFAEIWQKVAKKIAGQKNATISISKPILKSEIPTTKLFLKLKIPTTKQILKLLI
jgi:hypothetical protein